MVASDLPNNSQTDQISWQVFDPPASLEIINLVEQTLGVKFPADFFYYAQNYHGGWPDKTDFVYVDSDRKSKVNCFATLLSFNLDADDNIIEIYNSLSDEYFPNNIVPIGENGGGDYICLDYRDSLDSPSIILWMHERHIHESTIPIAQTFTDFLNILQKPTE